MKTNREAHATATDVALTLHTVNEVLCDQFGSVDRVVAKAASRCADAMGMMPHESFGEARRPLGSGYEEVVRVEVDRDGVLQVQRGVLLDGEWDRELGPYVTRILVPGDPAEADGLYWRAAALTLRRAAERLEEAWGEHASLVHTPHRYAYDGELLCPSCAVTEALHRQVTLEDEGFAPLHSWDEGADEACDRCGSEW